ncbi:MAG: class I SAM-dependent methyltransferase [Promethearchaeota archaeon]
MIVWVLAGFLVFALLLLNSMCRRIELPRTLSFEGIEPPGVVQAFDYMSRLPPFKIIRRLFINELNRYRPTGTLVDVGCGPGYLIVLIAKKFPSLQIIGMDIAQNMVNAATRNITARGLAKRVDFRQGDIHHLPFNDGTLDFVVSTLALHHWEHPSQALREIHRVLNPGGQFLIYDFRRDALGLVKWFLRFITNRIAPKPLRLVNEPFGSLLSAYTPEEVLTFLKDTPFRHLQVKPSVAWMFIWGQRR